MTPNVSQNIKSLRTAKKMTQSELADRVGVSKATISTYEVGTRLPSYDILIKLAAVFHVTTDNILGFSNKYVIDVSKLNNRQRNVVQEIVSLYTLANKDIIDLMASDSISTGLIAHNYVNEFDIEEYKKDNNLK